MEKQKFTINYSCKHYFGVRTVEAETKQEAIEIAKQRCYNEHPTQWDSSPKVKRECGNCDLKLK